MGVERTWKHVLGDGHTSDRIVDHLVGLREEIEGEDPLPQYIDRRRRLAFSANFSVDHVGGGGWERPRPDGARDGPRELGRRTKP